MDSCRDIGEVSIGQQRVLALSRPGFNTKVIAPTSASAPVHFITVPTCLAYPRQQRSLPIRCNENPTMPTLETRNRTNLRGQVEP